MNPDRDHALERELAAIGLEITRTAAAELARLTTASEFERALVDRGLVASRREAGRVLQLLKARARPNRAHVVRPDGAALAQVRMMRARRDDHQTPRETNR